MHTTLFDQDHKNSKQRYDEEFFAYVSQKRCKQGNVSPMATRAVLERFVARNAADSTKRNNFEKARKRKKNCMVTGFMFLTLWQKKLFQTMSAHKITSKLISPCRNTVNDTKSPGLRQIGSLLCNFVNCEIFKNSQVNKTGTIYTKGYILLAYADCINIVGRTERQNRRSIMHFLKMSESHLKCDYW